MVEQHVPSSTKSGSAEQFLGDLISGTYCSRIFTDCDRKKCRLQSPNFPGLYPRNLTCYYAVSFPAITTVSKIRHVSVLYAINPFAIALYFAVVPPLNWNNIIIYYYIHSIIYYTGYNIFIIYYQYWMPDISGSGIEKVKRKNTINSQNCYRIERERSIFKLRYLIVCKRIFNNMRNNFHTNVGIIFYIRNSFIQFMEQIFHYTVCH